MPRRMIWAWERPEDLRFVDPEKAGIAFLAGTIRFSEESFEVMPRRQTLVFPTAAYRMPVVRLERAALQAPRGTETQIRLAAETVASWCSGFSWVQVDYDATLAERPFYRRLLEELRRRLPAGTHLSATALASWCLGDPWFPVGLVDELVPMLFEMGPDEAGIRERVAHRPDFPVHACNSAVGLLAGDDLISSFPDRRIYLFSRALWKETDLR